MAALQGVEIRFFVRIKANIALGSFLCHGNHSDHLFDFWSKYKYRGVKIINSIIIKVINNAMIKPMIIFKTVI